MKPVTERTQLSRLVLKGYKSIKESDLELGAINILIGPNGAGKSNFIGFFKMIQQVIDGKLQLYVGKQGGPDALLHFGRVRTPQLQTELYFGDNGYKFTLEPTADNRLMFAQEALWWKESGDWRPQSGHFETTVEIAKTKTRIYDYTVPALRSWRVYHFHDTGDNAPVKQLCPVNDNAQLRADGGNLAAFLYRLQQKSSSHYQKIVKTVQLVAPFFGDFHLRPSPLNAGMIELEWVEKDQDLPFKAHQLSDGTLRFICLATVLLQPYPPPTILVDEPELGLHPYAITVLASMIQSVALQRQVIISTQSVELLNHFDAEDVIVADRKDGCSSIHRLDVAQLSTWLEEYSLGELWLKNLLGGRPAR